MTFRSCKPFNSIPNTNINPWFFLWWLLITITLSFLPAVACIPIGTKQGIHCKEIERKALLTLKAGLVDKAGRLSSWSDDDNPNCCNWKGVSCNNHTGHVLKLNLGNPFQDVDDPEMKFQRYMLEGEISSSLLELKYLEYLDLSLNNFNHNKIPAFLGSLEKLRYLNLSSSSFSGIFPPHLGNLSSLEYLDMGNNGGLEAGSLQWLMGMSSLKYVNLDGVDLSKAKGTNDWLGAIFSKLPMLMELHLSNCGLSNLPMSIKNHSTSTSLLSTLDLSRNNFSSSLGLPPWLFNLTRLVHLQLSLCSLSVPFIPHEIGRLVELRQLDLSDNYGIGGQLPASLGNLTNLVTLNLGNTLGNSLGIGGRIPATLGHLCKLRELDMRYNRLEGDLREFFNGLAACSSDHPLETVDFFHNRLFGTLPSSLGSLVNLVSLDLSYNSFWGSIPTTIESLTALKYLYLPSNKMNGTIARSIGRLPELEVLDLSGNQWRGQMLNESHFEKHTKLQHLYLSLSSSKEEGNLVMNVAHDWLPPFRRSLFGLRLDGVKMSSKKFPRWTQTLRELESLTLQNCGISDYIPTKFWKSCPNLNVLDLSNNAISIDATFKNMGRLLPHLVLAGNLKSLYLVNNSFGSSSGGGGDIPSNIGQFFPSLVHLDLSSNSISGEIPHSICQLQYLEYLYLGNNMLTGELTHLHWEKMMESLIVIDVSNNRLVGKIPQSLAHLENLIVLLLNDNNLEGELPVFRNIGNLEVLDLGGNKLTGNIPPTLGSHNPRMLVCRLRGNMLCGTIPQEICLLSQLQTLDLAHNYFQGLIPWCLGNLSTTDSDVGIFPNGITLVVKAKEYKYDAGILRLVHLVDLSHNNLSGNIPESLMNLTAMQTLNLSMNHLTGEIPSNIGLLHELETLDLSQNHMSGPIPSSISDISSLNYLNLSHNNFSGRIPLSRQLQTLTETNSSSYDGNPLLCGDPLPTKCAGDSPPKGHQGEGEKNVGHRKRKFDIEERGFVLSIVLGFAVGFWGVCGSLVLKPSWRQAYFGYLVGVKEKLIVAVVLNVARLQRKMGISE